MGKRATDNVAYIDVRAIAADGLLPRKVGEGVSGNITWGGANRLERSAITLVAAPTLIMIAYRWRAADRYTYLDGVQCEQVPVDVLTSMLAELTSTSTADDQQQLATWRRASQQAGWHIWLERLTVVYTPMPRGGARPWLICPRCEQRVAVVYLHPRHPDQWACRTCTGLCYRSQLRSRYDRPGAPDALERFLSRPLPAWFMRAEQQAARRADPPPPEPTAAPPRPRGRPRSKRKYTRRPLAGSPQPALLGLHSSFQVTRLHTSATAATPAAARIAHNRLATST